jgi:hypothetical protein
MRRTLALSLFLVCSAPAWAWAALPGQPCQPEQVGTTTMADDKQNIIACLLTGDTGLGTYAQEWKSMSSGGGITGGCDITYSSALDSQNYINIKGTWGHGCLPPNRYTSTTCVEPPTQYNGGGELVAEGCGALCGMAQLPGYSCGEVSSSSGTPHSNCACVKN